MRILMIFAHLVFIGSAALAQDGIDLHSLPTHAQKTFLDSADKTGLWILGTGMALTVLAHQTENPVRDSWTNNQQMHSSVSRIGDYWGQGSVLILAGQIYWDPKNGIPATEGFLMGSAVVQVFKYSIRRERPDKSENVSMPSGHSQAAFSLATSMTESYGIKTALPFWGMAALTGLSRIADDKHWLSDVVAGSTLGIFFGRAGFKHHRISMPVLDFQQGKLSGASVSFVF
jgi:membrane-associated phospholipid phosphatase